MSSKSERLLALAAREGVLRPKDLAREGIQAEYLRRFCARGLIRKVGRGSYVLAARAAGGPLQLSVTARAVPNGVICLRSALALHGLGRAPADSVDLAIEHRAARPRLDYPALNLFRLGGAAFSEGVVSQNVEGVALRVYALEKTLADLFKFRNKLGPHLAVDGLRVALASGRVDLPLLWHSARINRVERIMKPYVDALLRAATGDASTSNPPLPLAEPR